MFIKTTQELINLNGISRLSLCNNGKTLIACYQGNDEYSILKKFKEPMEALLN